MRQPKRTERQEGFSLLEIVFYVTILGILGFPIVTVLLQVSRSSAEGDLFSRIIERNRSMIHRIAGEYRNSLRGTTSIPPDGKSLQFTTNAGCDGTGPLAGPVVRYEIRLAPGEVANGADDNGNGLADEGALVRVDPTTGEEVVLLGGLDTALSSFGANGGGVVISLATYGKTRGAQNLTEVRRSITVYPRS